MNSNIPFKRMITESEMITLDDVIAVSIKNIGTDAVYYNWNQKANSNDPLLSNEEDPWACEEGGTFKGQKLYIDFGGAVNPKCMLKMVTRGKKIIESQC